MSMLIRLYPQAWRDRYEAEVRDLLEQRPASLGASVDLVRGAADAHLHPQGGLPTPWTHRLPGFLTVLVGLALSEAVLLISFRSGPDWGPAEGFVGAAIMLMLVCLPGDYLAEQRRAIKIVGGVFGASIVAANMLDRGDSSVLFAMVASLLAFSGTLATAALRAGFAARGRWILVLVGVFAPLAVVAVITVVREWTGTALVDVAASTVALFALPYGLAWLLVGLRMTVRGSATIVDPPPSSSPAIQFDQEIPA